MLWKVFIERFYKINRTQKPSGLSLRTKTEHIWFWSPQFSSTLLIFKRSQQIIETAAKQP